MNEIKSSFARLRIDLDALAANYQLFQSKSIGEVGAVVKANGYGLGAARIAQRLRAQGCGSFFVATLDEALELVPVVDCDVYIFEPPIGDDGLANVVAAGCIPVVNTLKQLEIAFGDATLPVAAHIDTGMERLGIPYKSVDVERLRAINPRLLLTHLACADEPDNPFNKEQVERFQAIAMQLPNIRTSIGNSAGTLNGALYQGDVARPGIGLYGANPFAGRENPTAVVAACEARVLNVREVSAGTGIGYGQTFTTSMASRIAVVGMGYADGLPRALSNAGNVAFKGQLLPIRGHVSMDLTQIDATACPELAEGDWVEFFGKTIDVDEVATTTNSLSYEFLSGLGSRVERLYV